MHCPLHLARMGRKRKFDRDTKNSPRKPSFWHYGPPPTTARVLLPEDSEIMMTHDQSMTSSDVSTDENETPSKSKPKPPTPSSVNSSISSSPVSEAVSEEAVPAHIFVSYHDDQGEGGSEDEVKVLSPSPVVQNESGKVAGDNIRLAVQLLNMCNQAQVPLTFYEKLLRLFKNYAKEHENQDHKTTWKSIPTTRDKLLDQLKDKISCVEPTSFPVTSTTQDVVPKFPFLGQLIHLFSTPHFQNIEACCVNANGPALFGKYCPPPGEGLSETLGARWYQETYDLRIGQHPIYTDPETKQTYHNWLIPVIWYNDKTGVSAMEGSYSLEPFMFTVGVLRRKIRESDKSWRHLGFIPCRSEKKKKKGMPGGKAEQSLAFTHECMSMLLEDFVDLQKNPPLLTLKLFGKVHNVRLILEGAFVIGDQVSQDTHCCRKKINAGGAGRVHRSCLTSFINASKTPPEDGCHPVSKAALDSLCDIIWQHEDPSRQHVIPIVGTAAAMKLIKKKIHSLTLLRSQVARDILEKVFSTYPVHNAWSKVTFGANINGIHRAALDDPMHYNASGLFPYLSEVAFKGLQPKEAEQLETYMRQDFSVRSSVRYDLPRGKFTSGFTNCTLQTSNEKVGIIHALYLSLDTPRVAEIYEKSILRQQIKYDTLSCFPCHVQAGTGKKTSSSEPQALPKLGDRYFFKEPPIKRHLVHVQKMVQDLNTLGVLAAIKEEIEHFDRMHTEYLMQILTERLSNKEEELLEHIPQAPPISEPVDPVTVAKLGKYLRSRLRKKPGHRFSTGASTNTAVEPITEIQPRKVKHHYDKPTVKGSGDTSCILTDVKGFRKVLELALLFYGVVHEFHELDSSFHEDLPSIRKQLDTLMGTIFDRVYRGDNGIDMLTCKCHAHFHLTADIEYYGAPMNYDAGKGERNLKFWAKEISQTARKCGQAVFIEQCSRRVSDHMVLQHLHDTMLAEAEEKKKGPIAAALDLPGWTHKPCSSTVGRLL